MSIEAIGRYRILGVLGVGGFATVYLAEDPRLDAKVAIKVLDEKWTVDSELRRRFIEEARVMRRLAAPGLVAVHDIDEYENRPYFVMEYCTRGTLADRLATLDRPLTLPEGLGLARALTQSTAGIHKAGVVHRDLKPSNYLIREIPTKSETRLGEILGHDEELVVADFGLAKIVNMDATQLSIAAGTPGYSAPEQFRGDPTVDARADVYALSAILLSALSDEQPQSVLIPGSHAFTPTALNSAGPLASELARGLSIERQNRHHDVLDWHQALVTASNTQGRERTTKPADPPDQPILLHPVVQPNRRSRRRWTAIVVALLGLVATGSAAFFTGNISLPGPTIHGPASGSTGDQAVFAVDSLDAYSWSVDDRDVATGRIISITPTEPGTYKITATSGTRATTVSFVVVKPVGVVGIDGPGLAPIGEATRFTAIGPETATFTWVVAGEVSEGSSIDITPAGPGTIDVELIPSNGETVRRTITASEFSTN